jgi:hypothetical protein
MAVTVVNPGPILHAQIQRYDDPDIETGLQQVGVDPDTATYRLVDVSLDELQDTRWFPGPHGWGHGWSAPCRRAGKSRRPEPATRSFTVEETTTSSAPASDVRRAAMATAMPPTSSPSSSISPVWRPARHAGPASPPHAQSRRRSGSPGPGRRR